MGGDAWGTAKCVVSLRTYLYEACSVPFCAYAVHDTLSPRSSGRDFDNRWLTAPKKYTGLVHTLRLVIAEEGARSLYGGLSAHLMRVVPNAAVMFWVYEGIPRRGKGSS